MLIMKKSKVEDDTTSSWVYDDAFVCRNLPM